MAEGEELGGATPEEARQSLVVLVRRRDQGLVTADEYLETRRRLVRAALKPPIRIEDA